ncbi:uncharacterized protein V1510DRAFT_391828 [Dipodascopsis tothii]|uniref:uncharacterized protein n=1 Tax=Dipodascopsis tothii TaxID=44089 RepID=UPI0034CE38F3
MSSSAYVAPAEAPYFTPAQTTPAGAYIGPADAKVPKAFQPFTLKGKTFQNRIWVSPMCQYSYEDGFLTDWTLVALGSYAVRGASLTIVEATAIRPEGRISPNDAGLWKDEQIAPLKRVADFIHSQNQKIGIQIAHSGRLGSTPAPWTGAPYAQEGTADNGFGSKVIAPVAEAFAPTHAVPHALTVEEIKDLVQAYADTAKRAVKAGVDAIEIHGAHGYLLNEFLSPAVNTRTDEYGGSFENRTRFAVEIVKAVKAAIPDDIILMFRTSGSDRLEYRNAGWTSEDTVKLAQLLQPLGVDFFDVSSGGATTDGKIEYGPGFQAPLAYPIKEALPSLAVGSVGVLHDAKTIDEVLEKGLDVALVGRPFSHNPNFVLDLAEEYGIEVQWPAQIGYTYSKKKAREQAK